MTLRYMQQIAEVLRTGRFVLFEGQMRPMFIYEAIELSGIMDVQIILADCDDATRVARLTNYRMQPELADENMMGWARYLREEASGLRCEILDTGALPLAQCVERIRRSLRASQLAQREHCY